MKNKKHKLLIGAHISITGGIQKSLERGESIGCTTIQIFTKSNRQWNAKKITQEEIDHFKKRYKLSPIRPVIVHSAYLINIGSPKKNIEEKSIKALELELYRCKQLGLQYLVLHPGSHLKTGERECLDRIARNLNTILKRIPGKTMILLENMAGQGSSVCYSFEQIAYILKKSNNKQRLGVCFDTCHAFAAGYDFRNKKKYNAMWKKFDHIIGFKKLKAIHINDSKKELGSCIDRHEDIGKGKLGSEAFQLLFNDKRFFDIPKILETPKNNLDDDKRNIKRIKRLLLPQTKHKLEYIEEYNFKNEQVID